MSSRPTSSPDTRWARELLPTSDLGSAAHCGPRLAPPPALPESTWDRPFSGLHYAALTAPGPTGTRPEHITDLLNVPRRIHANKVHAALSALFCGISAGSLPPAARWLTRTRLCWQRKKNGKPRPIKMGEFLRSAYAKRLVNLSQVHLRTKTLRMHQWGGQPAGGVRSLVSLARHDRTSSAQWHDRAAGGVRPGPCQHVWQC